MLFLQFLSTSVPSANSVVTLPNGHTVPVNRIGAVQLTNQLVLDNVLFVPQFRFNLLLPNVIIVLLISLLILVLSKTFRRDERLGWVDDQEIFMSWNRAILCHVLIIFLLFVIMFL